MQMLDFISETLSTDVSARVKFFAWVASHANQLASPSVFGLPMEGDTFGVRTKWGLFQASYVYKRYDNDFVWTFELWCSDPCNDRDFSEPKAAFQQRVDWEMHRLFLQHSVHFSYLVEAENAQVH